MGGLYWMLWTLSRKCPNSRKATVFGKLLVWACWLWRTANQMKHAGTACRKKFVDKHISYYAAYQNKHDTKTTGQKTWVLIKAQQEVNLSTRLSKKAKTKHHLHICSNLNPTNVMKAKQFPLWLLYLQHLRSSLKYTTQTLSFSLWNGKELSRDSSSVVVSNMNLSRHGSAVSRHTSTWHCGHSFMSSGSVQRPAHSLPLSFLHHSVIRLALQIIPYELFVIKTFLSTTTP